MKRYYQNRFIIGAMLAFLILIMITVTGIWLFSYQQMEHETDSFIQNMQSLEQDSRPAFSQSAPPPMFGYTPGQRRYPSGFYDITMNADGTIQSIQQHGILEDAGINVQQVVQQAIAEKMAKGKIGAYKYGIVYKEDETARIILLDISIQLQGLYNVLKSAVMVSAALMIILFLILLPVSHRVAKIFVQNAEKQKQFITDAGHDLKTPIAIVRSNLDVMELLQGKSKWSDNIRSQVSRMEQLVGQLMMMAKLDEMEGFEKPVPFFPDKVIEEETGSFLSSLQQKEIVIRQDIPDEIQVMGHEKAFRQMVRLLIDNAAQYTNRQGNIIITAKAEKQKVRLLFSNTVEKLPDLKPDALTERFVRGSTARTQKDGGFGIGLSAAKRIAEMHHGKLEISYPDQHTFLVTVELPALKK